MEIDQNLSDKILAQIKDAYPDTIHSNLDILPSLKTPEEREEIRKHLLILRDKGKITFVEGEGAKNVKPLLFNIRLKS